MSRVERTIQLAATGDRLSSSEEPVFTNTPEYWPVPASESGPQLLAQLRTAVMLLQSKDGVRPATGRMPRLRM